MGADMARVVRGCVALTRGDLPLSYRYVSEWAQWRWDCLACGAYGLRSDSRYNMRDTVRVALRQICR